MQYRFWPEAGEQSLRQVHPPDRTSLVDQELSRTRKVLSILAALFMEHPISANSRGFGIRQECERVALAFTQLPSLFVRIDTDRDDLRLSGAKVRKSPLEAPQLGVAQESPVATVEDQQYSTICLAQLSERNGCSVGRRECEIRRPLTYAKRVLRGRKMPGVIEDAETE
jgi:hypothetical protein